MGVTPIAAHMFIFYFAIISFITPPVAISAYAASGISGANAMKTGFLSFRLGLAGFIAPFLFLYSPSIVLEGSIWKIIVDSFTAVLGIASLAGSLVGWLFINLSPLLRLLLLASAIALIVPNPLAGILGAAPLVALFVVAVMRKRRSRNGFLR
jgi:TRAP-type uncharacterized transport system fused permease subunit